MLLIKEYDEKSGTYVTLDMMSLEDTLKKTENYKNARLVGDYVVMDDEQGLLVYFDGDDTDMFDLKLHYWLAEKPPKAPLTLGGKKNKKRKEK